VPDSAVSTELVRRVRNQPPERLTDYRDSKVPGFVLRARPSGVHSWRVQLPNRQWLTLGRVDEVSLADARDEAQQRRAKAALGLEIAGRRSKSDITLVRFLNEQYEPWMKATRRGHSTQVDRIRWAFKEFLDDQLAELTTGRVERWRASRTNQRHPSARKNKSVSPVTVNQDLRALRAALSRAVEWGILNVNPIGKMKHATVDENAVIRHLSPDEERRLRKALSERDDARRAGRVSANTWRRDRGHEPWPEYGTYTDYVTPFVLVALNTGLRRGELLQLQWRDIELERRTVTVRGEGAKTGQTRHVPLNSEIAAVLRAWRPTVAESGWFVFGGRDTTTPLTEARKAWRGLLRGARISSFRFHDLRHTFASKLVMAGVDLNTVRELLGHRKISMTLRYAHLAPEHKADAVERLVGAS
jgi:integrase